MRECDVHELPHDVFRVCEAEADSWWHEGQKEVKVCQKCYKRCELPREEHHRDSDWHEPAPLPRGEY